MATFLQQHPFRALGFLLAVLSLAAASWAPKAARLVVAPEEKTAGPTRLSASAVVPDTLFAFGDTIAVSMPRRVLRKVPPLPRSIDPLEDTPIRVQPTIPCPPRPPLPPPPPPPPATISCGSYFPYGHLPLFPGCEEVPYEARRACADQRLLQFIHRHLTYPARAREEGIKSNVIVRFVVEKDGSIGATEIIRGPEVLGQAVLDAVQQMNKQNIRWQPGRQGGRPVAVAYHLPVRFCLR